ncbi:MAG TPA: hypothetical protein VGL86_01195 [Polyangia bacterium]|jgi:hypothetical protein
MTKLVDCPSCGGLIPAGGRCCPHCHCRYSPWRRLMLLAGAALGLAGCSGPTNVVHYGPGPTGQPQTPVDMAVGEHD